MPAGKDAAVGGEIVIVLAELLTETMTVLGGMACAGVLLEPFSATERPAVKVATELMPMVVAPEAVVADPVAMAANGNDWFATVVHASLL